MVLEDVVGAGFDQGIHFAGGTAAVAHGAVEGVGEGCWEQEESDSSSLDN